MADQRNNDPQDESWTEMEPVPPEAVEILPIRQGMVLAGRYAIEQIIGRGGSGVVVRAHDRDLRAQVAIKIVRAELAGQRVWTERLAREVRLARQINHPNVCRVFDFEQADGRAFLVMELADRGTLRDEIRSGALAARPVAARIADARAVTWALDAIHRAGIVHRDLSPQNLLRMGDERLVLSDFGLAVDASDTSSSVHGGTVAYMAPEVMRGGKATFASDIWGLGVVVHELVFGVKPRWSEGVGGRILPPELGRPLTKDEGGVLETCRACTRFDPAHRIARAANVGVLLVAPRRTRRLRHLARLVRVRRPLVLAGALTVIAALAVGLQRGRHAPREMTASSPPAASPSPVIVPAGEPADWTEVSTVLVQVPKRITCTRLLPDKKTIRFVWGSPPRAEDIDTFTRERVLSPLVPAAYAEGCPDLSPDGERLLFQGHTADGRPFAFVSEHPDGRDAVPVVQTAEATMSSEPTWLSSGDAFSFDVDSTHAGVFSIPERGLTVIPEATSEPVATTFRNVVGDVVFISALAESGADEIVGFSWPSLREDMRLRTRGLSLDLASGGGSTLYLVQRETDLIVNLVELDRQARTLRRLGGVHDQIIRQPRLASSGLAFLSVRLGGRLVLRSADGASISIASEGKIFHAAHCGEGFVVQREHQGVSVVERVDRAGKVTEVISRDPRRSFPGCSPDGRTFFYLDRATQSVMRCDQGGCRSLPGPQTSYLAVSPDGERLALMRYERRGVGIWWMSSDGGPAHYVSGSETACTPGWASSRDLWVSRRRNGKPVWVEVDVESGRQTGRIQAGSRDCSDGRPDPATPVDRDIQVVYDETSQLRLLDHQFLRPN